MINALSIDLEYWWCSEFLTKYLPDEREDILRESLNPLLGLLEEKDIRATFFVLGAVAEDYPDIVEDIFERGHEIGCHAYSHRTLYELDAPEFEREIKRCLSLLSKYNPRGFRAPSFSLDNSTRWALDVLQKYGFQYDSSIFPVRTNLYGVPEAPLGVYRPSKGDVTMHDPEGTIIEFPLTALRIGFNVPVAGGFYLRLLPRWFLSWAIGRVNKKRPANIYVHPHDVFPDVPRINLPVFPKFVTYHGAANSLIKLRHLIDRFSFKPICDILVDVGS
ncbi:MAG: polysaccharide deacetylase family protein [Methanomicrobiaceae archaeon]|uniref:polysaccharide deacetylase family protein n=1 Tax=Methanoculleus sp. TaxID=90427 RepID=UPI00321106AB|nr:polysaccharide deacetylase family protein [Methanomicrobiaceae archaeon]